MATALDVTAATREGGTVAAAVGEGLAYQWPETSATDASASFVGRPPSSDPTGAAPRASARARTELPSVVSLTAVSCRSARRYPETTTHDSTDTSTEMARASR